MSQKMRVMFDTCIYETLVLEPELAGKITNSDKLIVYGCRAIRKELRETPPTKKVGNRKLRILLLEAYGIVAEKHDLQVSELAENLATQYLKKYAGNAPARKIFTDFLIVAVASLKRIPIICTDDESTMASDKAKQAYSNVNQANNLEEAKFISFGEFRRLL